MEICAIAIVNDLTLLKMVIGHLKINIDYVFGYNSSSKISELKVKRLLVSQICISRMLNCEQQIIIEEVINNSLKMYIKR